MSIRDRVEFEALVTSITQNQADEDYQRDLNELGSKLSATTDPEEESHLTREINKMLTNPPLKQEGYVMLNIERDFIVWIMESNEKAEHCLIKLSDGTSFQIKGSYEENIEKIYGYGRD